MKQIELNTNKAIEINKYIPPSTPFFILSGFSSLQLFKAEKKTSLRKHIICSAFSRWRRRVKHLHRFTK